MTMMLGLMTMMLATTVAEAPHETVPVMVWPTHAPGVATERRDLVDNTVEARIAGESIELVQPGGSAPAAACADDPSCRDPIATAAKARFIVRARVDEPKPSDYVIRVELFEVGVADPIAAFDDACTICSEADLVRIVRERSLDAREAIARRLAPVETKPDVVPPPEVKPPPRSDQPTVLRPSPLRLVGWGLTGAGIAGTLGGVALLAMHGSRAGCPDDPRGGGCLPLVYRTVVPGAVVLGGGVALLATGVALVVVGKRRDAAASRGLSFGGAAGRHGGLARVSLRF